jgi:hypothetical protein
MTSSDRPDGSERDPTRTWFRKEQVRRARVEQRLERKSEWFRVTKKTDWTSDPRLQRQVLSEIRLLVARGMDDETEKGRGKLKLALRLVDNWVEQADRQVRRHEALLALGKPSVVTPPKL